MTNKPAPQKPDVTQHILYQHILALLAVEKSARAFISELHPSEYSPEEKAIAQALSAECLVQENSDGLLLQLIESMLIFLIPGIDFYTDKLVISAVANATGERGIALNLEVQPGKNVVKIMTRGYAEHFEKTFKKAIDEHFGRLIKL